MATVSRLAVSSTVAPQRIGCTIEENGDLRIVLSLLDAPDLVGGERVVGSETVSTTTLFEGLCATLFAGRVASSNEAPSLVAPATDRDSMQRLNRRDARCRCSPQGGATPTSEPLLK